MKALETPEEKRARRLAKKANIFYNRDMVEICDQFAQNKFHGTFFRK